MGLAHETQNMLTEWASEVLVGRFFVFFFNLRFDPDGFEDLKSLTWNLPPESKYVFSSKFDLNLLLEAEPQLDFYHQVK